MTAEAMVWVLNEAPELPPHAFGVLMGLANHADKFGRGAYPSQQTLADYARKSVRQVRRDLEDLKKAGLIREGDTRLVAHLPADARPLVWDLAMERVRSSPEGTGHPRPVVDDRADVHVRADTDVRSKSETADQTSNSNEMDRTPTSGRTSTSARTSTSDELKSFSSSSKKKSMSNRKRTEPPPDDPRFDEFWAVYPRHDAKLKGREAFAKAVDAGVDPAVIIKGAAAFAQVCAQRRTEKNHMPLPASWLNGQRWEDEHDARAAPGDDRPPPPHCGVCDLPDRTIELHDGSLVRCPDCHPDTERNRR